MTTPSTARKAGPFTGNGTQNSWPFTFKVFAAGDIKVTIADATGAETVLTLGTDYTVSLNANQDTSPGGSVTYLLANTYKLTVTGDLDYDQGYDIPSGGNFNPVALENQLDRMVMQTQQLAEQMVRAVKVPVTDDGTGELSGDLAQGILVLSPIADDIATVAGDINAVENVSVHMTAVSAVGGNITNVNTVAGISSNVTSVAGNATNINAVAAKTTQITQVAAVDDEVAVVAGIASNVTAVAGIAADIPTVADNLADITNFADVYQGPKAADPTLRNDGGPLFVGDLYFRTTTNNMRAYGSAGWVDAGTATPVTITPQAFSGNGSTTAFTLSAAPAFPAALDVYIGGVHQELTTDYTVSGTTLTFVSAPPSGTDNVRVKILTAYAGGVTNDGSVTTLKLADDAVTAAKIAAGAVGTSEIANDAVTADKIAAGAVGSSEMADGAATGAKLGADVVKTTGNQTIAGTKTFTSSIDMVGTNNRFVQINDSSVTVTEFGVGALTGSSDSVGLNNKTATGSVSIGTNDQTRIHVKNDGKVGIGTTTPAEPLHAPNAAIIADTYIGMGGVIELGDQGSGDRASYIDFHSSGAPSSVDHDARIIRTPGANGALQIENKGTGAIDFLTNGTTRMFITAAGRINMPNGSASRGTSGYPITTGNDTIANATRASGYIEWASDIGAIGTNYFISDIRKKENIAPSTFSSLSLVEQIEFVEFDWKPNSGEEGHVQVGVIAQQLQQLDSRLVAELSDGSLMVKEPALVTHLAKALQEQQAIIKQLQADLAELKSRA